MLKKVFFKWAQIILLITTFAYVPSLQAEETVLVEDNFKILLTGGLSSGGDTLVERSDGTKLKAGGLLFAGAGAAYRITEKVSLQALFGYHFDYLAAENGDAEFTRTYLEAMPVFHITEQARIGLGVMNVFSPEYSDPFGSLEMDDATGVVAEWSYKAPTGFTWGIRYTDIEYDLTKLDNIDISAFNITVDGSYLGLVFYLGL